MHTRDMTAREQVALRRAIASFCSELNHTLDLHHDFLDFVRESPDKCDAAALGMSHQQLVDLVDEMSNHPFELRLDSSGEHWT